MGDVVPNPSYGVEHHIHTGGHPPVFAKNAALTQKNLKLPSQKLLGLSLVQHDHWSPLCTWFPKKMGRGSLVVITVALI
jgi:hypothetical protein